jgi:methylmalonyl-CoA carboxyltransferase 5S subunit
VFNVLMGRYKVMTAEFADLMLGYYGRCLGERNPEVVAAAEVQTKKPVITERPADLLPPEWDELRTQALAVPGCNGSDEDVLTHAMFPKVAPGFFASRPDGPKNVGRDPKVVAAEKAAQAAGSGGAAPLRTPITYKVTVNGAPHSVSVAPA